MLLAKSQNITQPSAYKFFILLLGLSMWYHGDNMWIYFKFSHIWEHSVYCWKKTLTAQKLLRCVLSNIFQWKSIQNRFLKCKIQLSRGWDNWDIVAQNRAILTPFLTHSFNEYRGFFLINRNHLEVLFTLSHLWLQKMTLHTSKLSLNVLNQLHFWLILMLKPLHPRLA